MTNVVSPVELARLLQYTARHVADELMVENRPVGSHDVARAIRDALLHVVTTIYEEYDAVTSDENDP